MTFLAPISTNPTLVVNYIERYEKAISDIEPFFSQEGQKLIELCQRLPQETFKFKRYLAELKSIESLLELQRAEFEGKKYKSLLETNQRALAARDIQQYIKGDKDFVHKSELILEISHIKQQLEAVLEGLNIMHWQLNNQTKLVVASLEEYEL
jgi:selenocysteine-specific translation elongation factor